MEKELYYNQVESLEGYFRKIDEAIAAEEHKANFEIDSDSDSEENNLPTIRYSGEMTMDEMFDLEETPSEEGMSILYYFGDFSALSSLSVIHYYRGRRRTSNQEIIQTREGTQSVKRAPKGVPASTHTCTR
jgi:hypothetical protein